MGDKLHALPLINYYLVIDLIVTILLLPYCYIARRRQVNVNIMKNIFTLNAVQKIKQAERRKEVKHGELQKFKTYFKEKELEREEKFEEPKKKTRNDNKPYFYKGESKPRKPKKKKGERKNDFFLKEQDETSESGEDSTETSDDEDMLIKQESRTQLIVREEDY